VQSPTKTSENIILIQRASQPDKPAHSQAPAAKTTATKIDIASGDSCVTAAKKMPIITRAV
jgi:hypothetical protein